jgi:peptidoglycan/xylan/chitin deacetylase (PgdA/CDA1 family)
MIPCVLLHPYPALAPVLPAVARRLRIARTIADRSGAALTFDDGPHPNGTPAVLEVLAQPGSSRSCGRDGARIGAS